MQDLEGGVRVGRGRFSSVPGGGGAKVPPFIEESPVVTAHRLLDAAAALSDGASRMEERLRELDPDQREVILELVTGEMTSILGLWADLVRGGGGGSSGAGGAPAPSDAGPTGRAATTAGASAPADAAGSGARDRAPRGEPERRLRRESPAAAEMRLLPRRPAGATPSSAGPARAGDADVSDAGSRERAPAAGTVRREPWATPLRTVTVDEGETEFEGDRLTRDELTGVLNRQAGFAALGRELDRCRRAGERFVLGYLDVDGLKEVNSAGGLRAGDELLRKVTAALRATLRSYDVIMRLGGDEFLFSLPGADMATAELRASEFGVILNEEAPGGSASVGFGELRGNDTLDEIISRAESELAKNRRSGRGR
jgi:diguanylate cyclase (GGDEF)-like protein